jgi:ferritin-like metal-binding protein YciE
MALNTPRDLFLYELSAMRDAERTGGLLLGWMIGGRVQSSDLQQILRAQEKDSQRQLKNIESCLKELGSSPLESPSATVEGMRSGFEEFTKLRPSPEVLDLFALDTAMRFMHFGIASYKGLVDWAVLMGKSECTQSLQANVVQKEESAGKLERIGHEMRERILATV